MEQIEEFKTRVLLSGLSLPLGRELLEGAQHFSSGHRLHLGTGATGSLLKRLWCGCKWTPSIQVQSSSATLPGTAKDGSMRPQQELLALQKEEKRSR